jgi:hypothetical protein
MSSRAVEIIRNERGIVLVVALGIMVALAVLSLAVSNSSQMSTLTSALASQAANAFYVADGAAYYSLADDANFVPGTAPRTTDLTGTTAALTGTVVSSYLSYRSVPGNLLIRTTDGNIRPGQFGQNDGLGKMYFFLVDAQKNRTTVGVDPASRVQMQAAKPGPCADCGT